jgi:ubiquinone/menaquinone biosynthesis C-methylase UbiE
MGTLHRLHSGGLHICPWWFGYTFDNPLRRLFHDPAAMLAGLVGEGDTVADIGCGLGYFSIGLAGIVGRGGKVIAIDVQPEMIERARRRAERRGVADVIEFRVCAPDRLGLAERLDFALAFWMLHEVPRQSALLAEVRSALEPGGRLLIVEPKGHVGRERFDASVRRAIAAGFEVAPGPPVRLSRAVTCTAKPLPPT